MTRTDPNGNPLPDGCVARLGSRNFSNGGFVTHLDFALGGKAVVTHSRELVRVWGLPAGNELRTLPSPVPLNVLAVAADGRTAAGGTLDIGRVFLFDLATGQRWPGSFHLGPPPRPAPGRWEAEVTPYWHGLAFSPDGRLLACGDGPVVRLWDPAGGGVVGQAVGHGGNIRGVAFSPDGLCLATASEDTTVLVWDVDALRRGS